VRGIGAAEYEAVRGCGISVRGYIILLALSEGEADSQLTLGRTSMMDKSTLVRAVDEMEEGGYLVRTPDPADRRVRSVSITERGKQVLERAALAVAKVEEEFLAVLPPDQRRAFRAAATALATGPSASTFDPRPAIV